MTVHLRPIADRIVVRPTEIDSTLPSGLIIPETAKERPKRGVVEHVGAGRFNDHRQRIPLDVEVGDEVLFQPYGAVDVELNGEQLLMLRQDEVLAVIEDDEDEEDHGRPVNDRAWALLEAMEATGENYDSRVVADRLAELREAFEDKPTSSGDEEV